MNPISKLMLAAFALCASRTLASDSDQDDNAASKRAIPRRCAPDPGMYNNTQFDKFLNTLAAKFADKPPQRKKVPEKPKLGNEDTMALIGKGFDGCEAFISKTFGLRQPVTQLVVGSVCEAKKRRAQTWDKADVVSKSETEGEDTITVRFKDGSKGTFLATDDQMRVRGLKDAGIINEELIMVLNDSQISDWSSALIEKLTGKTKGDPVVIANKLRSYVKPKHMDHATVYKKIDTEAQRLNPRYMEGFREIKKKTDVLVKKQSTRPQNQNLHSLEDRRLHRRQRRGTNSDFMRGMQEIYGLYPEYALSCAEDSEVDN